MGTFYMSILCYEAMSACWCGLGSWFELPVTLPLSYNHKQLLHNYAYVLHSLLFQHAVSVIHQAATKYMLSELLKS